MRAARAVSGNRRADIIQGQPKAWPRSRLRKKQPIRGIKFASYLMARLPPQL